LIQARFTSHPVCEKHGWPVNSIFCQGFPETTETIETRLQGRNALTRGWKPQQSTEVLIASVSRASQQKNAFLVCGMPGFRQCISGNKIRFLGNRNETIVS
jgi:hypothetical protein